MNLLARLWTEKEMTESSLQHLPVPYWQNSGINQFYAAYVGPNTAAIGSSGPAIIHILTLLDDKKDCFSDKLDPENQKNVSSISLREHSLCVARMAVDLIKKAHRDYELILGKILIISLGHCIGILSAAAAVGGISARSIMMSRGQNPKEPAGLLHVIQKSTRARLDRFLGPRCLTLELHLLARIFPIFRLPSSRKASRLFGLYRHLTFFCVFNPSLLVV